MPGSGSLTLSGTLSGFPVGPRTINTVWNLPAALDDSQPIVLQVGIDTQVFVPSGASMVLIDPPPNALTPVTLKGAFTDTGITLNQALPHWQSLDGSVSSFWLSISQALPGPVQVAFF